MEKLQFSFSSALAPGQKKIKMTFLIGSVAYLSSNQRKNQDTIRKNTHFGIGKTTYPAGSFIATRSFLGLSIFLGK
jgi:hypothetical protein